MADGLGLSPAEVNYQLSHLQETKGPAIHAGVAVLSVLATIAVFLRFLVRWRTKAGCRADDYTVFAACVRAHVTLNDKRGENITKQSAAVLLVLFHFFHIPYAFRLHAHPYDDDADTTRGTKWLWTAYLSYDPKGSEASDQGNKNLDLSCILLSNSNNIVTSYFRPSFSMNSTSS